MLLNILPILGVLLQVLLCCQAAPVENMAPEEQISKIRTARSFPGNDVRYNPGNDDPWEDYWNENDDVIDYSNPGDDMYDDDVMTYGNDVGYENTRTSSENFLLRSLYRYIALNVLPKLVKPEKRDTGNGRRIVRPSGRNQGRTGSFRPFNKCKRGRVGGVGKWVYGC